MNLFRNRARLIVPALAGCLVASSLAPLAARAHEDDLVIGGTSVIADANGDRVRLRSAPGYDEAEITRFPEGTEVEIIDGTWIADDGSTWYKVSVDGQTGYMVSDFLDNAETSAPSTGRATTNDSVNVRAGAGISFDVVTSLDSGQTITLTGGSKAGWVSVSTSGGDGWVYATYLDTGAGAPETPEEPETPNPTGTRYTIDTVHLRQGPGTGYDSITYLKVGVRLGLTGEQQDGFVQVTSDFGTGWVSAQYIGETAPGNPETPAPDVRYTIDTVHLRKGPGTTYESIEYLDRGVKLELTGEDSNGFVQVDSDFGRGWVASQYLGTSGPTAPEEPEEPETPANPTGTRYTSDSVNLRSASNGESTVIRVLAIGTKVELTGQVGNGFAQVTSTLGNGWISAEFLTENPPSQPEPEEPAPSSLVVWPVKGGEWFISQGYNGSSHQNRSSSWQYVYSFDLKRSDGNTAGQPVYSAVSGTVRWIDESTGGMSIYMGNGLAYAYFHTRIDPSIQEGDTITQGQYMGTIAPASDGVSGGVAHLHITVWETNDGGNWSRIAVPFTGEFAISGVEFPSDGSSNDWRGYTFNP